MTTPLGESISNHAEFLIIYHDAKERFNSLAQRTALFSDEIRKEVPSKSNLEKIEKLANNIATLNQLGELIDQTAKAIEGSIKDIFSHSSTKTENEQALRLRDKFEAQRKNQDWQSVVATLDFVATELKNRRPPLPSTPMPPLPSASGQNKPSAPTAPGSSAPAASSSGGTSPAQGKVQNLANQLAHRILFQLPDGQTPAGPRAPLKVTPVAGGGAGGAGSNEPIEVRVKKGLETISSELFNAYFEVDSKAGSQDEKMDRVFNLFNNYRGRIDALDSRLRPELDGDARRKFNNEIGRLRNENLALLANYVQTKYLPNHEIPKDGNCMFHSIADSQGQFTDDAGLNDNFQRQWRNHSADYLLKHAEERHLIAINDIIDPANATNTNAGTRMTYQAYKAYIDSEAGQKNIKAKFGDAPTPLQLYTEAMRNTDMYGGALELEIVSERILRRPIYVFQPNPKDQQLESNDRFGSNLPGRPILMFYNGSGHFQTMIPRE